MQKYDLYIANPIRADLPDEDESDAKFRRRGWVQIGQDLEFVRRLVHRILDKQGNAYVVPVEYRVPRITQQEAFQTAQKIHSEETARGRRLAPITLQWDDILWWTFSAEDLDLQDRDIVPGDLRVSVDKLDGHVCSEDEYQAWVRLSSR